MAKYVPSKPNPKEKKRLIELLIKKTQKSKSTVTKMINDYYDVSVRRGAETPNEIAKEIKNFWIYN